MRALAAELAIEKLADHRAVAAAEVQRDVSVLGHGKPDRRETCGLLLLDEAFPIDHGDAVFHADLELAGVGKPHGTRRDPAFALQGGGAPHLGRHEREHPVDRHARLEDVLDREPAVGPDREIRLDGHGELLARLLRPAVFGEQGPGQSHFLHVALAVGVFKEGELGPLGLGVAEVAFVELLAVLSGENVLAVAVPPGVPV